MANNNERFKRRGGLKQNLALPGESNRAKIMGGVGAKREQDNKIISEKTLEQPVVKPGGIRGAAGRVGRRVGRAIRKVGLQPSAIATNLLTREKAGGDRIVSPKVTEADIQGGVAKRIASGVAVPTFDKKGKLIGGERKIGTSILTQKDGVDILRGTKPPATQQIDFTRGSATEVRVAKARRGRALARTGGVQRRGRFNIVKFTESAISRAGDLANIFTSPEFRAEQREARGARLRRKGRRADVKLVNERINALSSTLANIPDLEGNEEIRNTLTTQIADLISKGSTGIGDATLNDATKFKKAGFSDDEVRSILGRLGAVNAA